jgi:Cu-Zn family superoxide dismutase
MRVPKRVIVLLLSSLLASCASQGPAPYVASQTAARTVWVVRGDGRAVGQAMFTEGPRGVMIRMEFPAGALPPGWHGLHLHGRGDCSDFAAGFQAAGGHLGMNRRLQHGLLNARGPEPGDLPNLFVSPNGVSGAEVFAPDVTLGPVAIQGRLPLLDADGAALVIHANPDDQVSQPIGNAGARIACAALTQLP